MLPSSLLTLISTTVTLTIFIGFQMQVILTGALHKRAVIQGGTCIIFFMVVGFLT